MLDIRKNTAFKIDSILLMPDITSTFMYCKHVLQYSAKTCIETCCGNPVCETCAVVYTCILGCVAIATKPLQAANRLVHKDKAIAADIGGTISSDSVLN